MPPGQRFASDQNSRQGDYIVLGQVESGSSPGKFHEIRESRKDGKRYCTCRGWVAAGKLDGTGCTHFRQRPDLARHAGVTATVQRTQGVAVGGRAAPVIETPVAPAPPGGRFVSASRPAPPPPPTAPRPPRPAPLPAAAAPRSVSSIPTRELPRAPASPSVATAQPPPADRPADWVPGYVPRGERLEID